MHVYVMLYVVVSSELCVKFKLLAVFHVVHTFMQYIQYLLFHTMNYIALSCNVMWCMCMYWQLKVSSSETEASLREQLTSVQEQAQQQISQLSSQVYTSALLFLSLSYHFMYVSLP